MLPLDNTVNVPLDGGDVTLTELTSSVPSTSKSLSSTGITLTPLRGTNAESSSACGGSFLPSTSTNMVAVSVRGLGS